MSCTSALGLLARRSDEYCDELSFYIVPLCCLQITHTTTTMTKMVLVNLNIESSFQFIFIFVYWLRLNKEV